MKSSVKLLVGMAFVFFICMAMIPMVTSAQEFSRVPAYEVFGDPATDFFIHAYTDLTYWDYEKDHTLPLQFHSPQDDHGQFSNYFTALFVGSHISDTLSVLSQIHFHLNPIPGQVGPTVVIPQAKLSWRPLETENVRLHFGRFYSPFGITNDDVQTPLNRFVSQPYTGFTAIPFHWFDTGIQLDLAAGLTDTVGANLTVAFINGPQRIVPDVPPGPDPFNTLNQKILIPPSAPGGALLKTSFTDLGSNVALRVGLFPGVPNLEIGGSYTTGTLRDEPLLVPKCVLDATLTPITCEGFPKNRREMTGQYAADWNAVGVDLQYHIGRVTFRGDWNRSTEELIGANALGATPANDEVEREAWRAQVAVHVLRNMEAAIKNVWLTFRAGERDPDKDIDDNSDLRRYTFGINLSPHHQVMFKANYEIVQEVNGSDRDNNGVLFQMVANF